MKKTLILIIPISLVLLLWAYHIGVKKPSNLPDLHAIPYDAKLDTLNNGLGADDFNHSLDHADSNYYKINDYYNMKSADGLHILPNFQTYQQTMEYSCGCASALMVLNHYADQDYNEMDICRLAETDTTKGTSVEGLAEFFKSLGWETTYHADTVIRFQSPAECEEFFITTLDSGAPIMVDWTDWSGHWDVVIGLDTCNTENPYDDVLIMADPYDVTDHYQDGYYVVPLGRFFYMWHEGPCAEKTDPYQQPFVVAIPEQQ